MKPWPINKAVVMEAMLFSALVALVGSAVFRSC